MNKLIKAEGFRLKRQITFLLICSVICAMFPAVTSIDSWNADLGTQVGGCGITIMSILMLFPAIFASITGSLYDHGRLGYYEIMAGNKTFAIVFSKLATDGVLFLVLTIFHILLLFYLLLVLVLYLLYL